MTKVLRPTGKDWLTPHEVGNLIGFSAQFIRGEIKAGELHAEQIWSRGGKMGYWKVTRDAALAYAKRLQISAVPCEKIPQRPGVYFVRCHSYIKIGKSSSVIERLAGLEEIIPIRLEPLGYVPDSPVQRSGSLEKHLHRQFSEYRHKGEWFHDSQAIRNYIAEHAVPWPDWKPAARRQQFRGRIAIDANANNG